MSENQEKPNPIIKMLAAYFEHRGFRVDAQTSENFTGLYVLYIRKQVGDKDIGADWAITQTDIAALPASYFFELADQYIARFFAAMATEVQSIEPPDMSSRRRDAGERSAVVNETSQQIIERHAREYGLDRILLAGHWIIDANGQPAWENNINRHWRVEALYDGRLNRTKEYEGEDYEEMQRQLARLCLTLTVDKIFVHRDGELYRHIELR